MIIKLVVICIAGITCIVYVALDLLFIHELYTVLTYPNQYRNVIGSTEIAWQYVSMERYVGLLVFDIVWFSSGIILSMFYIHKKLGKILGVHFILTIAYIIYKAWPGK